MQDHRGAIRVHSKRGQGSRFEIYFPLTREPGQRVEEADGPLPTGLEWILFVVEEDITLWTDELLQQQGFRPACFYVARKHSNVSKEIRRLSIC